MNTLQRRQALVALIATPIAVAGCRQNDFEQIADELSTDTLQNARVGLRGFQLVSFMVGQRIILLPAPGVRILGAALLVSGIATFLVVEYLDIELKRRTIREELSDDERMGLESSLALELQTENGLTEKVALGANQYEDPNATAGPDAAVPSDQ